MHAVHCGGMLVSVSGYSDASTVHESDTVKLLFPDHGSRQCKPLCQNLVLMQGTLEPASWVNSVLQKEMRACLGDVRLAAGGVVGGVLLVHDARVGVDHLLDNLGQLQHGELRGVADVEGARVWAVHHPHHACTMQHPPSMISASDNYEYFKSLDNVKQIQFCEF